MFFKQNNWKLKSQSVHKIIENYFKQFEEQAATVFLCLNFVLIFWLNFNDNIDENNENIFIFFILHYKIIKYLW